MVVVEGFGEMVPQNEEDSYIEAFGDRAQQNDKATGWPS